ncbi:MAG: hypothetical protein M1832_000087 [Thelocarpon impressellum]|nr:MAG: hypothetical protein M1832_000087 [Thelocarpon impressellum]
MAPPRVGPRPYKDILTPALHRRFTNAASVVLLVCYAEAIIIGENTSVLWFWFPFGSTGIRTLLLFISALAVFILRVAQLHVGTVAWYFFSAWWFSEVYVWSSSKDAELAWISDAK